MKKIKLNINSSWDEIKNAQEIIGLQKEIKKHIDLCKIYKFTKEQTERQLIFMYGKNYRIILNMEIIT